MSTNLDNLINLLRRRSRSRSLYSHLRRHLSSRLIHNKAMKTSDQIQIADNAPPEQITTLRRGAFLNR